MNLRTLSLSVAVLAAACLAIWFWQRPAVPVAGDARVGNSVLSADLADRATKIRITDNGKAVTLARQSDGTWRVATYHELPADFMKLGQLIGDLTGAKILRFVTARPERLSRLEFKDTTITLLDGEAKEIWSITLGKNADGGGRFLRYDKEEKGYQAGPNFALESESKNWTDTTLLNLKQEEIANVELGFADGTSFTTTRAKKEDPWTAANVPAGKRPRTDRIASLLGNLVSLRFSDTTAPDDPGIAAAKAHRRTLKLTTFAGETYTVTLARKPEEKNPKPSVPSGGPASPPAATPVAGTASGKSIEPATPETAKPSEPEFETIPAGPVYAFITSSNEKAPINDLMKRRAFQIAEWTFNALPANATELWEDLPTQRAEQKQAAPQPAANLPAKTE